MEKTVLDYLEVGILIVAAAAFSVYFILVNYRSSHRSNAPVETARAFAYYKHPDMEPSLNGRHSSYTYYITFHTDSGDVLKLYMNPTDYFSIAEGSWGLLTWLADRFWKFEKEE